MKTEIKRPSLLDSIRASDVEGVRKALARGEDPNQIIERNKALGTALQQVGCRPEIIQALVEGGADLNYPVWPMESPPLMVAIERSDTAISGDVACAEVLLRAGADIRLTDKTGSTMVAAAAGAGLLGMLNQFVERGLDPDARNRRGWSALMIAALFGRTAVVTRLLELGADPCAVNDDSQSAADIARRRGFNELADSLAQACKARR